MLSSERFTTKTNFKPCFDLFTAGPGCDVASGTSESVVPLSTVPFVCKGRHVADPHTFCASSADADMTPASCTAADAAKCLAMVCPYLLSTIDPTQHLQLVSAYCTIPGSELRLTHVKTGC